MSHHQHLSIKDWALEDRPREKLLAKGLQSLSDAELLAILLGSGSPKESAVDLAKKILKDCNHNLHDLGKKSISELKNSYHGIGDAKAISIVASLELGRRRKGNESPEKAKITCSRDAYNILYPMLCDLRHEEFWILLLHRTCQVIRPVKVSQGGVGKTIIDIKIILKTAIENLATAIILCHNHPSGNTYPSPEDKAITKKLIEACKLMDIPVLDHIIIGDNQYYSFGDEGML